MPRPAAVVYLNPHALAPLVRSELFERLATAADRMPAAVAGLRAHERAAVFVTRSS